jgi:DNA-binding LacI/PurR family transcriptional regulator
MRVPTTLQDVAREAGVSMKTVSRVVNNEAHVAQETRDLVLRVIADMGYVPHLQAQRLASGRTRAIALHYPLEDPALISSQIEMDFITGIALGAADQEYFFSLMTSELTATGLLKFCRGAHADGLVLMQVALEDWRVDVLRDNDYPFVMIGRTAENDGLSYIDLDMEQAILDAYAHLVGLGHRQIAFLTFSQEWRMRGIGPAMRGLRGFHKAVEKFEVTPLYRECELEVERARCVTLQLMTQHPRLTALVAVHNTLAVGAIRALNELERKIPEDCSILGVAIGKPELVIPPLTSLDFAIHDVGRQAAHMLIDQLKTGRETSQQVLVRPTLRLRSTTSQALSGGDRSAEQVSVRRNSRKEGHI